MPFERKLPVNFVDELRDEFGNNIDASHVKKFATKYSVGYATVSRKLKNFPPFGWHVAVRSIAPNRINFKLNLNDGGRPNIT